MMTSSQLFADDGCVMPNIHTQDYRRNRHDTIKRAIALIDTADPDDLARYLVQTDIHDHLKADPGALRHNLATVDGTGRVFSAWKASQQLLKAAGLPY